MKTYNVRQFNYPSLPLLCSKLQPLASLYGMNCMNEADSMCQAGLRNIYCTVCCKHSWLYIEKSCQVRCRHYLSLHCFYCISISASRGGSLRDVIFGYPTEIFDLPSTCQPRDVNFLPPNIKTFKSELHCLIINGVFLLWLVVFLSRMIVSG